MSLGTAECPVCRTPISQTRFAEIQQQVRLEETEKLDRLRDELRLETDARVDEAISEVSKRIKEEAEQRLSIVSLSRDKLSGELKEAKQREEELQKQRESDRIQFETEKDKRIAAAVADEKRRAEVEAERKLALSNEEQKQLRDALAAAQQREAELQLKQSAAIIEASEVAAAKVRSELIVEIDASRRREGNIVSQLRLIEKERDDIRSEAARALQNLKLEHFNEVNRKEQQAKEAADAKYIEERASAEKARKELADQLGLTEARAREEQVRHTDELRRQREALDQRKLEEFAQFRAQVAEDKEALRKTLAEAERKLDQKTANELGKWPEVEIEKALREAFSSEGDDTRRVGQGQPGVDVVHTVKHKGQSCGAIVIDSKNHLQWRESFVKKLSQDCLALEGKHSILSTAEFPSGVRDLSMRDGVILAKPNQVVALVDLLRRTMIQNHILGLGLADEGRKKDKLYELITSDSYRQYFEMADRLLAELQQIEIDETSAHKKVWEKRGTAQRRLHKLLQGLNESIAAIVERPEVVEGFDNADKATSGRADQESGMRTRAQL